MPRARHAGPGRGPDGSLLVNPDRPSSNRSPGPPRARKVRTKPSSNVSITWGARTHTFWNAGPLVRRPPPDPAIQDLSVAAENRRVARSERLAAVDALSLSRRPRKDVDLSRFRAYV